MEDTVVVAASVLWTGLGRGSVPTSHVEQPPSTPSSPSPPLCNSAGSESGVEITRGGRSVWPTALLGTDEETEAREDS